MDRFESFFDFQQVGCNVAKFLWSRRTTDDLWAALSAIPSDIFEIQENPERQIKRKNEIPTRVEGEADSKTIYVEKLPVNVTLEMLQHVFSKYGTVNYISMPKFKHNGFPKGFAFVEFADDEGAKKSIEAFVLAKRRIPCGLDPGELQSIKSYQIEKEHEQKTSEKSEPPKKKAKIEKDEVEIPDTGTTEGDTYRIVQDEFTFLKSFLFISRS